MKVGTMTGLQPLTRRNTRSRKLVAGAALAGVGALLGLTALVLATVAAASIVRKGMDRMGMPSSELHRRFFTRRR
jgi:hypothetical protein